MKKSKLLISLVAVILLVLVIGNVMSLATEPTQITASGNGTTQIGATNTNNSNTNTNANTNTNTNTNSNTNKASNIIGATNTNKNTNTNRNTNTNKVNTSNYNSASTNTSKLPYAGTNSTSIVLIAIGFAVSAVYAYKKVTDYNI